MQPNTGPGIWRSWTVRLSVGPLEKGRSASRPINGGLRRAAALLLISDCYPLLAWTISRWNWADMPSRVFK